MITYPICTADAVTALCDEQVTAVRSFCADMLISNGQQSIKSNILAQCKASNYLEIYKRLFDLDPVVIICTERWSQIHGIFDE